MTQQLNITPAHPELLGLVEASPGPLWIARENGERGYFNGAWYSLTGRSPDGELGHGWRENIHPEDRERVDRTIASARQAGRSYGTRYRLACQHDEWRDLEEHGRPVLRGGQVEFWLGTCRDTTQERREHERYRSLAELVQFVAQAKTTSEALNQILFAFDTEKRHGAIFTLETHGEPVLRAAPYLPELSLATCSEHIRNAALTAKPVIVDATSGEFTEPNSDSPLSTLWALPFAAPLPGAFGVFFHSSTLPSDEQVEELAPWTSLASLALRIDGREKEENDD